MVSRLSILVIAATVLTAAPAAAQGFGIGPRLTFVKGADSEADSQRFTGAAIRLGDGKAALEAAMDFHSSAGDDLTERVKSYPIQLSLLYFPVRTRLAPYLIGGMGWYSQRVEALGPVQVETETTRKIGWHAGVGGELRLGRHIGAYGDYRYTFIDFGGDDPLIDLPLVNRLKASHEGSMFAWGVNFYF